MFTATAPEMVDTDQPNSACSGSISTPGTARNAAAPTRARNVTAATDQAGCSRRRRAPAGGAAAGAGVGLTVGQPDRWSRPRASGRMANMCNDRAMSSAETARPGAHPRPARHEVAVLALPGTIAFELGLPHRLLGSAVDGDG